MSDPFLSLAAIATLLPLAFVSSITPGPNNIMLTASGVNFGLRRTYPHMAGIFTGFGIMLLAVGFGLGALFTAFPAIKLAVKFAGIGYLLYLAAKIAFSGSLGGHGHGEAPKPFGFLPAVAFQWVNPKAWVMAVSAMAVYVRPGHAGADVPVVAIIYMIANLPCMFVWAGFGVALREALQVPSRIRIFNALMGALLLLSVLPMLD